MSINLPPLPNFNAMRIPAGYPANLTRALFTTAYLSQVARIEGERQANRDAAPIREPQRIMRPKLENFDVEPAAYLKLLGLMGSGSAVLFAPRLLYTLGPANGV